MRPGNFILLFAFLLTSAVSAQTLTYRISNMSVVNSATDSLVFDVELKASAGGTYIRSLQVAINYSTAAFGSNIASNVGLRKRALCDGKLGGVVDNYAVSASNNTSSRFVIFVLTNFTGNYLPGTNQKEPTTTFQKLVRVSIPITDPTELPKVSLNTSSMSGQQFHQLSDNSPSSYSSPVVSNSGNGYAYPLQTFDIIWDGATWTGGSGGSGEPTSSDNTLDMLVQTATTDPMPANATVQRLIILDSATLNLGGNTLTITGELIGSVSGSAINGTIELAGAAAQTISGATTWENLTINNSNGVTIDEGTQIITEVFTPTDGTVTTNGNLVLASTAASTYGQIAAEGAGGSISGNVTFQMVISEPGWHNLGSPLSGMTLDDLEDDIIINYSGNGSGVSAYSWDAATADFIAATDSSQAFTGGWNIYIDNNFVRAGGGVNGDGNLPVVLDLTGSINTGNTTSTINYTSTVTWSDYGEGASDGWNLIPNPYPSNLDWSKVDDSFVGTDYEDTYYIWKQSLNSGDGGYVAWNSMTATNGGVNNIAPLQAIWVKLNNAGATSTTAFDFINSDRTTSSPATHLKNQEKLVIDIVRNSNPDYSDNVVFVREPGFSLNEDARGDITKFYHSAPEVMNFYNITPDSALLAANVIDRSFYGDTAFLGVKGNLLEDYTISIAENTFPQDFMVKLYDRKTGVTTDLLNNNYTFTNDTAFDEHRFDLIAVANDISVEENGANGQRAFRVRVDNGIINVDFLEGLSPEVIVEVIDMSGRQLYSEDDISTYGPLQFQFKKPLNDVSYYILRVIDEDNNMAYSEKFLY